jgi:ketosteroid isomerase-like protein
MSRENVELVYQAYDAFNRRDLGAYLALTDADVEVGSRLAAMEGGFHGHEGIRRWWQNMLDASPDRTVEIVEVRDLGDVTLTLIHARGHGAVSDVPYEETIWSVARWCGKKAVWWGVFPTEAEPSKRRGCGSSCWPRVPAAMQVDDDGWRSTLRQRSRDGGGTRG